MPSYTLTLSVEADRITEVKTNLQGAFKKARQVEVELRRSLKHDKETEKVREAQEFEEWGRRNSASIAAALERPKCDEWN